MAPASETLPAGAGVAPRASSAATGEQSATWWRRPRLWVELFIVANLGFLGVDIFIAHAVNDFANWAEWVPVAFAPAAAVVLLAAMLVSRFDPYRPASRWAGLAVGVASVAVGVAGLLLHLSSQFFARETVKNLVYTAPFAAPLAFTGVGLLIILDRTVRPERNEWARWVIVLALGGFVGNFVLSLADHAQNGFFQPLEWVPVIAAAFAVGFLLMAADGGARPRFLGLCGLVLVVQALVGLLGFGLHLWADLHGPAQTLRQNFLYGAPIFAPLLFADLALLAAIGLWSRAGSLRAADNPA